MHDVQAVVVESVVWGTGIALAVVFAGGFLGWLLGHLGALFRA